MKAFILAAGFGTRLKPLTDKLPKALVNFRGEPMINYQIKKLKKLGFDEIIVNAHHFPDLIVDYFNYADLGINIKVIVEKEILGTGGGILNAKKYLKSEDFFLVVNVDVYTSFNFRKIIEHHKSNNNLVTLGVQRRETKRHLEFDKNMNLIRRENDKSDKKSLYAFNGIHIISNKIFDYKYKIEYNDIIDIYMDLIKKEEVIKGFNIGKSKFQDLGKIDSLRNF